MTPLSKLNDLPKEDFIDLLGGIYEHSEWIAAQAHQNAPFENALSLASIMKAIVDDASVEQKRALIQAHPDLGGKLAQAGALTPDSTREQAGLGLDRLSAQEYAQFSTLNTRYRERFGFPFIICARRTTKDGVLEAFAARLRHTPEQETTEAMVQIHHIAQLRLNDLVEE